MTNPLHNDHYNLKCALVGFLVAGFIGFAFSSKLSLSDAVDCPPQAAHTALHK